MMMLERLLIAYTVFLMKIFEITPEQIERSRDGGRMRPEGATGLYP